MLRLSRRSVVLGGCVALMSNELAGCVSREAQVPGSLVPVALPRQTPLDDEVLARASEAAYGPVEGEPFPIRAVDLSTIDPAYLRARVAYDGPEPPGTIVIDPHRHYLYEVQEEGQAMRYGIGVGREGFAWSGAAVIKDKQEWPDWYPPKEMVRRQPDIRPSLANLQGGLGMHGGPRNPLGARAMYLWQNNKDTLYRIHGTLEPDTIGTNVSSGCIRMINQDVIDLYSRAPLGTKVVVLA
jgi:lipoprotein-anchoring transpeptidase ErfK/SrfK